tara:strand:+ start:193 stop:672 length:480 start_codon:yes stop_codon:yes gene_type:complete
VTLGIYGSSILTLDSKGRVAIPAKYREVLRDICEGILVITRDPQYPALMIYPGRKWKEVSSKFENLGGLNPKTRSMQWTILGNASVTEFEVSERMILLIPPILREVAGLKPKEKVALIGMGSKFEIWNIKNWKQKQAGKDIEGEVLLTDLPNYLEEVPF